MLQQHATYRKLFSDAFPEEAAQAAAAGDLNLLINDVTVFRATATFLRTTVTRDAARDRFVAGDNYALTLAPAHSPARSRLAARPGPERRPGRRPD